MSGEERGLAMSKTVKPSGAPPSGGPMAESASTAKLGGADERMANRVRAAEELARLQAAFPWSGALSIQERMQFASELAGHSKRATDRDLDRLLAGWKARAKAQAGQMRTRLRRAA